MRTAAILCFLGGFLGIAGCLYAQKSDEIGGVVASAKGPEAGVWVIAETTDLPTRYIKEVVTDDRGRYLIPALPKANYTVWARGYGLVDSPKVQTRPGKKVDLKPTVAPDQEDRRATIIRRTTGTRCSRFRRRMNFRARDQGQRHFARTSRPRDSGCT